MKIKSNSKSLQQKLKISLDESQVFFCVALREDGLKVLFDGRSEVEGSDDLAGKLFDKSRDYFRYVYISAEVDIDDHVMAP